MRMLKLDPHNWPNADEAVSILENYIKSQDWSLKDLDIDLPDFKMVCDEEPEIIDDLLVPLEEEEKPLEQLQ